MISVIDRQKISSRARLANVSSVGGMLVLLASVLLPMIRTSFANFSWALMAIGLAAAMMGIYYANRWVKRPRPEARLDDALKGLTDSYRLYHYPRLPSDHVLLTPAGVVLLETLNLEGKFTYRNGKWKEAMSIGRALRYIVEEHLGDPIKYAQDAEAYLRQKITAQITDGEKVPLRSLVIFVHPAAQLDVLNPAIPVYKVEKLRKPVTAGAERLAPEVYKELQDYFDSLTVKTDQ